jgi:hypothetical protein
MSKFNAKDALEDLGVGVDGEEQPLVTAKVIQVLSNITSLNSSNIKIVPLEVMKRIVTMLADNTITTNKLIISSLLVCVNHLASFERSRMLLGDSTDSVPVLIQYVEQFSAPGIQAAALDALLSLTNTYKKNQEKFSKQNLIGLMGIIQRESERNRVKACQLLDTLVVHDLCAHQLVSNEQFMESAVLCLEVRHTEQWAARFFYRLSEHTECCRAIVEYSGIDPLVDLLRKGLFYDNNAYRELCYHVLKALYNITILDNKNRQMMNNAIPVLFQFVRSRSYLLSSGKVSMMAEMNQQTCESRELCCKILTNITEDLLADIERPSFALSSSMADKDPLKKNKLRIMNCRGLPVLCHLMRGLYEQSEMDPNQVSEHFVAHSKTVQQLAIKIVANIAPVEENTRRMLGLEVVDEDKDEEEEEEDVVVPPPQTEDEAVITDANGEEHKVETTDQANDASPAAETTTATATETAPTAATTGEQKAPPPTPPKPVEKSVEDTTTTTTTTTITTPENQSTEQPEEEEKRPVYDAKTEEQLQEQMKDGLFLTNLLLDLLVATKDEQVRKYVISAISAFAIHPKCANQLVDLGIVKRLLEMLAKKVELDVIASLLSSMNVHDSFQKKVYSVGGLAPLLEMINSPTNSQEREYGIEAIGPFARTPNGRMILKKEGVIARLKYLVRNEKENERVVTLSREILKVLKSESDATLHSLTGESTGDEFGLSYDEIYRIGRDLISVSQNKLFKITGRRTTRLLVNWRRVEKMKDYAQEALSLLARDAVYDELVLAIEIFINSEQGNLLAFNNTVAIIIVQVNDNEETKDFCEVEIKDLQMKYKIAQNGALLTPKALASEISNEMYGRDTTNFNALEVERDEAYELAVEQLRRTTSDSRLPLIGDINILYFHLEQADNLWKHSFQENQGIIVAKNAVLDEDELFLKGWKVVKFNKDGLKQERLLLLTHRSYYTVNYDYALRKIDYKHCKQHSLEDYYLIDVGRLRESKDDDPTFDFMRPWALNLVTNEKAHNKDRKEADLEEEFEVAAAEQASDEDDLLTHSPMTAASQDGGSNEEMDEMSAMIKDVESAIIGEEEEETKLTRPSVTSKYSSVFTCPGSVPVNKQQSYMEEIALVFYAAACACRRDEVLPPFKRPIRKPGSNSIKAKLYNTFFGGKTGDLAKGAPLPKQQASSATSPVNNSVKDLKRGDSKLSEYLSKRGSIGHKN